MIKSPTRSARAPASPRANMTSAVTKAMVESYALMILVMGTFFLYFCGMVWAFCNPKLSEDESEDRKEPAPRGHYSCPRALISHPHQDVTCACARLPAAPHTVEAITRSTYVSFWDDTESLLSECTVFCREDLGINNRIGESRSWTA